MIPILIEKWELNKRKLEHYFSNTNQSEYSEYKTIVSKLFEICFEDENFDVNNMTIIDDGDYQGTLIFVIPKNHYQPGPDDYVVTNTYYGSCSGCDTLQAINDFSSGLPNESQVKEYMTLALHLVQKTKWLFKD